MKIGIITYHRAENYGSVLQTYALTQTIRSLGHTPEIIDYHSKKQDELYVKYQKVKSVMDIARNVHMFCFSNKIDKRKERFYDFLIRNIPLTSKEFREETSLTELNDKFDCFICGSDQIWNASCADFSDAYLLSFVTDKKKCLSYAASIGKSYINEEALDLFRNQLREYDYISVREETAKSVLEPLIGRSIDVVPDPVLLLSKEDWNTLIPSISESNDYILCYFIGDVDQMRHFANRLHSMTNLPLVLLNINLRDLALTGQRRYDAGPLEFIRLIRDAKYVCTNSFHATLFSLIYHKDFWTFTNLNNETAKSRIEQILNSVNLANRIVNNNTGMPTDPLQHIVFSDSDRYIATYKTFGKNKLNVALDSIERNNQIQGI